MACRPHRRASWKEDVGRASFASRTVLRLLHNRGHSPTGFSHEHGSWTPCSVQAAAVIAVDLIHPRASSRGSGCGRMAKRSSTVGPLRDSRIVGPGNSRRRYELTEAFPSTQQSLDVRQNSHFRAAKPGAPMNADAAQSPKPDRTTEATAVSMPARYGLLKTSATRFPPTPHNSVRESNVAATR